MTWTIGIMGHEYRGTMQSWKEWKCVELASRDESLKFGWGLGSPWFWNMGGSSLINISTMEVMA